MRPVSWFMLCGSLMFALAPAGASAGPVGAGEAPGAAVNDSSSGVPSALRGAPASLPSWSAVFPEPSVQQWIAKALAHNRDVLIAAETVRQAEAALVTRQADLWPTLQAGIGGSRVPTNTGGVSTTVTGGLLTAAYELDWLGRVRLGGEAAAAQLRASESLRDAVQISVASAVVIGYTNLQADEVLVGLARATVESRERALDIARTRAALGAASALEPLQAETTLQAARAALAQALRQQAINRSTLAALVGHQGELTLDALPPLTTPDRLAMLDPGLPSSVLAQRPDIRAAEAQLAAAAANVEQARLALFPRLTLTASLGQASRDLTGLFAGGSWIWGIAPQLLQPLWDAGRLRAGVDAASAAQRSALAVYERALQAGFKELFDALNSRRFLIEQWQAQDAAVSAEAERLRLAETRHQLGTANLTEVLDAQRAAWAAQVSRVQVQALVVQNQVNLLKALGSVPR